MSSVSKHITKKKTKITKKSKPLSKVDKLNNTKTSESTVKTKEEHWVTVNGRHMLVKD